MQNRLSHAALVLSLLGIGGWASISNSIHNPSQVPGSDQWIDKEVLAIAAKAPDLDQKVLRLGLTAYEKAREQGLDDQGILTIIDYSKPSTDRRLWVFDVKNEKVLMNTYVAHGKNSGDLNATSFSNEPNSLKSSFGVFVANETYNGDKGYSLRLKGLEPGINDNVYKRHVIVHGAAYVSAAYAKARGMMGRSWGCMAVSFDVIKPLINTIKNDTIVFAYYPNRQWLSHSKYLTT